MPTDDRAVSVVDVHNHYIPAEFVADARKGAGFDGIAVDTVGGTEWMVHPQGFRYPLQPGFYDHEARISAMDALGIDHQVLSIAPPLFLYWAEASGTVDFARMANDSLARFARDSGGRMSAVATLPMQDPDAAVKELTRAVGELGLRGAEIAPVVEGTPLDDPAMVPVLEAAQRLGVPLILHPTYVGPKPGLEDFYLTNLVGNPLETCVCAARLILSGLLDRLGALDLVLMHGGGFLPYQIGRLDHGFRVRAEAKGCQVEPSRYLRRFTYDTITHEPHALRYLVDLVGADRVAYGTDYPYDMGGGSFTAQTEGVELDPRAQALLAGENTARLFGLTDVPRG